MEALTGGKSELKLDEVNARDFFGDGVFDLQSRIGFDKEEAVVRADEEFEGADAVIVGSLGKGERCMDQFAAKRVGQIGGRGLLYELLMSPLQGTIAFP